MSSVLYIKILSAKNSQSTAQVQNADFISIYKGFDAFDCAQFNVESYQLLEVHIFVPAERKRDLNIILMSKEKC